MDLLKNLNPVGGYGVTQEDAKVFKIVLATGVDFRDFTWSRSAVTSSSNPRPHS